MGNIFFNIAQIGFQHLLIIFLILMSVSGLIIYLLYFVLSKILFRKSKHRREITLRITFLWTLFACFILFNVYLFLFFYKVGIENINFSSGLFYLSILPQILIYFFIIIFFFIKRYTLIQIINQNSLK